MEKSRDKFWERVDWLKEHRPDSFYVTMLDAVLARAKDGEVEAIVFLEKRGLIRFPSAGSRWIDPLS